MAMKSMQKYSILSFWQFNFRNSFSLELSTEKSLQCFLDRVSLLTLQGSSDVTVHETTTANVSASASGLAGRQGSRTEAGPLQCAGKCLLASISSGLGWLSLGTRPCGRAAAAGLRRAPSPSRSLPFPHRRRHWWCWCKLCMRPAWSKAPTFGLTRCHPARALCARGD